MSAIPEYYAACSGLKTQNNALEIATSNIATGLQAIEGFRQHKPDVTLMDPRLPDINGEEAMIVIRAEFPNARLISGAEQFTWRVLISDR